MINKDLFEELKRRCELDQSLINAKRNDEFLRNSIDNTLWIRSQISKYGWLKSDLVSQQGELFAWLIVQHSNDLDLQKKCLNVLKEMQLTIERKSHIAYLTDKILISEKKRQVYGTQFSNGKPFPIKDKKHLNNRRKEMETIDKEINSICESQSNKSAYNKKLSILWKNVVAYENTGSEVKLFLKSVKLKENYKILSIASGLAVLEMFLAKEFLLKGKIYCVDLSKEMNKQARIISKNLKLRNIKIIQSSAYNIPLNSGKYDFVLARRTGISHTKHWRDVLKEVSRLLNKSKGARFIYTVDKKYSKSIKTIKEELLSVGFKLIKSAKFKERDGEDIIMFIAKRLR